MKKMILAYALLAALFAASPAFAAEKSNAPADTETIAVSKAVELLNAINMLGLQHDELVGQGASQRVIAVPFAFSPDTLWNLSVDTTALKNLLAAYDATRKGLIAQAEAKNGGPLKPLKEAVLDANGGVARAEIQSPEQKALIDEIQKVFDSERPVNKLFRFHRGDLCLGGPSNAPTCPKDAANKIAPGVISALAPILEP